MLDYKKWWRSLNEDSEVTTTTTIPPVTTAEGVYVSTTPRPIASSQPTHASRPGHIKVDVSRGKDGYPKASVTIATESELALAGIGGLLLLVLGISVFVIW